MNKATRECTVKAKVDTVLLTLNEYSFRVDLECVKTILTTGQERYKEIGGFGGHKAGGISRNIS